MLETADLRVRLGRHPVLEGVGFTARPGAVTAIIGPNGSGKTTLLRTLAGDLRYEGSARLEGTEIAALPEAALARRRAVLAQATPVSFAFTVGEVVRLGLSAGTGSGDPAAALAQVGLAGYEPRLFPELSGGEQQRVHLARVLAQIGGAAGPEGPRWLFLDEPVSALDIAQQLLVMEIARDFARAGGGVVAVMHDLNLTAMIADSVALMTKGRLHLQGPPERVLADTPLSAAYGCRLHLNRAPASGPWLLPQAAARV